MLNTCQIFLDFFFWIVTLKQMVWGLAFGIFFVGLLEKIPREFIVALLGRGGTFSGVLRAAGVFLDLCSHGVLMVGMKLYERGTSLGQVMAFLIASPWNSFSLTLILWALIGIQWMSVFLLLSMVIAIISGVLFDRLVKQGSLPKNTQEIELPEAFNFWAKAKSGLKQTSFTPLFFALIFFEV